MDQSDVCSVGQSTPLTGTHVFLHEPCEASHTLVPPKSQNILTKCLLFWQKVHFCLMLCPLLFLSFLQERYPTSDTLIQSASVMWLLPQHMLWAFTVTEKWIVTHSKWLRNWLFHGHSWFLPRGGIVLSSHLSDQTNNTSWWGKEKVLCSTNSNWYSL